MPVDHKKTQFIVNELPRAHGPVCVTGILRQHPSYFYVEENLGFEPEGEGEHVFLYIQKSGLNTQYVADQIARLAGVAKRQISYSGMKDRHAVTRQWFSAHLPGNKTVDWTLLNNENLTVIKWSRHRKKLRRGSHKGNFFRIKLTQVTGDLSALESQLKRIKQYGVPNYFGEQRFGNDGANLRNAQNWFLGDFKPKRHQKSIYLSAARAYIFNQVLSERVQLQTWNKICTDEKVMLNGSRSVFSANSEDLTERLDKGDIHPTGPLYGKVESSIKKINEDNSGKNHIAFIENKVCDNNTVFVKGLEKEGLKYEHRALRMLPAELSWKIDGDSVELSFFLLKGCFATSLVRELAEYSVVVNRLHD